MEKKKGGKVADLAPMMNALLDLRQKYKSAGNESMQTTIKLIGNGTWGKLSQQTNALTPELMHDSILQEAKIHRSTHSDTIYSLITNPVLANWVTGFTRSVVAVTAYKNQAIMAVTDSVLIPGKWIESSNIKVPYGHLQNALNSTTWECEHKNVSAVIFRERDYYYYKCKTKDPERVKAEIINAAITNKSLKKMDVVKAAKLGKPSVKGEGAEKSRKQFAKDSEKRFIGEPIKFTHKKLISAKGMLSEGKILNQPFDVERSIGCHNLRHMCDTNEEFERRVMLKEKCRIKGWADTWHYEKHHPEAVKELRKRCTHNPQHKKSLPQDIQHLIMCAIDSGAASIRQIAEIIGIGKSTIHRWAKDFKSSGEAVQTTIRGGIDTLDYAYPVKALQRWMASTSAG